MLKLIGWIKQVEMILLDHHVDSKRGTLIVFSGLVEAQSGPLDPNRP